MTVVAVLSDGTMRCTWFNDDGRSDSGVFPQAGLRAAKTKNWKPFRLVQSRYDRETERAYVELRRPDDGGGEILVTAIFTYGRHHALASDRLSKT
jgi:uncharacterized protein YodC (DUF2158 family)